MTLKKDLFPFGTGLRFYDGAHRFAPLLRTWQALCCRHSLFFHNFGYTISYTPDETGMIKSAYSLI